MKLIKNLLELKQSEATKVTIVTAKPTPNILNFGIPKFSLNTLIMLMYF